MNLRHVAFAAVAVVSLAAAFTVGCASPNTGEDHASSNADITGSLGKSRACAVRDAYRAADVGDFTVLEAEDLPFTAPKLTAALNETAMYSRFNVQGVGVIFYIETTDTITQPLYNVFRLGAFYDAHGNEIVKSSPVDNDSYFYTTADNLLSCPGDPPVPVWDGGDGDGGSSPSEWPSSSNDGGDAG